MDKLKCIEHKWCECAGPGNWECHNCQKKKPKPRVKADLGINDLKYQILECLREFPKTRDSDITLTQMLWIKFWGQYIKVVDGSHAIMLYDLFSIPREDHIKRIRAKIQNEEYLYLPTTWEIAKQRHLEENRWREAMGYNKIQPEPLKVEEPQKLL